MVLSLGMKSDKKTLLKSTFLHGSAGIAPRGPGFWGNGWTLLWRRIRTGLQPVELGGQIKVGNNSTQHCIGVLKVYVVSNRISVTEQFSCLFFLPSGPYTQHCGLVPRKGGSLGPGAQAPVHSSRSANNELIKSK